MKEINKFECEYCHATYDTKEQCVNHENQHKANQGPCVPIKEIFYDDLIQSFTVYEYPKARYNKEQNKIQLYNQDKFRDVDIFDFENVLMDKHDDECRDLSVFTTNCDLQHERNIIDKIIDFRINQLNSQINSLTKLKNNKGIRIGRNNDSKFVNEKVLG